MRFINSEQSIDDNSESIPIITMMMPEQEQQSTINRATGHLVVQRHSWLTYGKTRSLGCLLESWVSFNDEQEKK